MITSARGIDLIARFEGFRAKPYNDSAGHCTVGYGHLLHRGHCTGSEHSVTKDTALVVLASDVAKAEEFVARLVTVPLSQNQFDALASLVFNIGGGAFAKSTLLRVLNAGRYAEVPVQIRRWVYAGQRKSDGLINRRNYEARLWGQAPLPAPQPPPPQPEPAPSARPAETSPADPCGGIPWLALGGVLLVTGAGWFLWTSKRGANKGKRKR